MQSGSSWPKRSDGSSTRLATKERSTSSPTGARRATSEYAEKEKEQREDNHIPEHFPILFLEIDIEDPSEFEDVLEVSGVEVGGHKVLRAKSSWSQTP